MLKTVIATICIVIASTLAVRLNNYLVSLGVDSTLALLISVAVSTITHKLLEFTLLSLPLRYRWLRHRLDPVSRIEGYWYEEVDIPENPYSYACIEYDVESGTYNYYGLNYDKTFNLNALFRSTSVEVESKSNVLNFRFQANVKKKDQTKLSGYGRLNFYKDGTENFIRGDGSFIDVDVGRQPKERNLLLIRIPNVVVRAKIDTKKLSKDQLDNCAKDLNIKELVVAIAQKRKELENQRLRNNF